MKYITTEDFINQAVGGFDCAKENGIIDDYDELNRDKPIERRAAARIIHQTLLYNGEEDETDWSAALELLDLYDCRVCANHIAQVYVKGIMTARDMIFNNTGLIAHADARKITARIADKSKRVIPEKSDDEKIARLPLKNSLELIKNDNRAVLADVRTADEYAKGHINESVNIPLYKIKNNPHSVSDNRAAKIILYCEKGYKSMAAAVILKEAGYKNIYLISE